MFYTLEGTYSRTLSFGFHQRLRGYYAFKPLYGRTDARGRVDRNAG